MDMRSKVILRSSGTRYPRVFDGNWSEELQHKGKGQL